MTTDRVSVASVGTQGNFGSERPSLSRDGRFVAFDSSATNLVIGDTNVSNDIFVHDRDSGETERVSVASGGAEAHGDSVLASISADGRFVAFQSEADDLVPDDTNETRDIFVHDRQSDTTTRVSVTTTGDGGICEDIEHCLGSFDPMVSANGRFIAFESEFTNLVPGDNNHGSSPGELSGVDIFVYDLESDTIERVSVNSDGAEAEHSYYGSWGATISANGRYVAFTSASRNLIGQDTNDQFDVFVHDRSTDRTKRVSVGAHGRQADGSSVDAAISGNGRYVAFISAATNLIKNDTKGKDDVFVRDRETKTTRRVSLSSDGDEARGKSLAPDISHSGRYVVFESWARNLVANDTNRRWDVFLRDRKARKTTRLSVRSNGAEAEGVSIYRHYSQSISGDGRFAAFSTPAHNLVANDTNDNYDVFVRGPLH